MIDEPETKIMNKLEKEGYKFTKKRISSQTESFEYKNGSFVTKSNKATSRIRFEIIDPKGQKNKKLRWRTIGWSITFKRTIRNDLIGGNKNGWSI